MLKLNSLTFLKSQPTLPVLNVTYIWVISHLGFYFDICEWRVLSARAWTPAFMLHLTNPCAKRKVLSLTKPKDKIYKTKSIGHYITRGRTLCDGSVSWGCRIHWLHFSRGVKLLQRVSWIWHERIWWGSFSNVGALGNGEYSFIAIVPRSILARSISLL